MISGTIALAFTAGMVATFGAGAMTNSIGEIRDADFLFVIGSNTSEAHPIIAMEMKRAMKAGATMVVADPRAIWMTSIADTPRQRRPGTDVWLRTASRTVSSGVPGRLAVRSRWIRAACRRCCRGLHR